MLTPTELREKAAERRRVGWEIGDVMTPGEMDQIANHIERLEQRLERSRKYWVEAAEIAIRTGDFRPLKLRVDACQTGPVDYVEQSRIP
mgnify:CR=1 FL=1